MQELAQLNTMLLTELSGSDHNPSPSCQVKSPTASAGDIASEVGDVLIIFHALYPIYTGPAEMGVPLPRPSKKDENHTF